MANICTNKLYLTTKDKVLRDSMTESIAKTFNCNDINSIDGKIFECEIDFDSKWTFPYKEMEKMTQELPEGNDLYIRVLSYEFNCDYIGYNIYSSGEWCDKFDC